jgi:16S rRNA (guanine527-N7)-methyltransferase
MIEQKKQIYLDLVREWASKINLIAPSTLADLEGRHWEDSVQLKGFLTTPSGGAGHPATIGGELAIIDLGSGAGFPAVPLAILGFNVIAIESIGKKARFLEIVKSATGLGNLTIWNDRVENRINDIRKLGQVIFVARAFASLSKILELTRGVAGARFVLLKGRSVEEEIAEAQKRFKFEYRLTPSKTGDGFVLELRVES